MKVLFVLHTPQEIVKFKYIIEKLNCEYKLLVDTKDSSKSINYIGVPRPSRPWWYKFAKYLDDYHFFKKLPQSQFFKRRIHEIHPLILRLLVRVMPRYLSFIKRFYKPNKEFKNFLKLYKPDFVFVSSLVWPICHVDQDFVIIAKQLGIRTVGFIHSWDSLTTKGKMWPIPDIICCWNQIQKDYLISYHDVSERKIKIVGAFIFEEWLRPHYPTQKNRFFKKHGLDINKETITYLSSSNSISGFEIKEIEQIVKQLKNVNLIIRPHPDKGDTLSKIDGVKVIPAIGENLVTQETFQLAYDTYYWSDKIYGINTSAMIEAMLINKIVFKIETWNKDVQDNCLHFKEMESFGKTNSVKEWLCLNDELPSDLIKKVITK